MGLYYSLASSSQGCCSYIKNENNQGILIDCGISFKKLKLGLSLINQDINNLCGIFITHEHIDHIKGLLSISENLNIPIYLSSSTLNYISNKYNLKSERKFMLLSKSIDLNDFHIIPFKVPHDALETYAYSIYYGNKKLSICTDLGHINFNVLSHIVRSDLLVIESNYDDQMIYNNNYPLKIKNRITSNVGHLSNDDCANALINMIFNSTTNFCLAHISMQSNTYNLAIDHCVKKLKLLDIKLNVDYKIDYNLYSNQVGKVIEF